MLVPYEPYSGAECGIPTVSFPPPQAESAFLLCEPGTPDDSEARAYDTMVPFWAGLCSDYVSPWLLPSTDCTSPTSGNSTAIISPSPEAFGGALSNQYYLETCITNIEPQGNHPIASHSKNSTSLNEYIPRLGPRGQTTQCGIAKAPHQSTVAVENALCPPSTTVTFPAKVGTTLTISTLRTARRREGSSRPHSTQAARNRAAHNRVEKQYRNRLNYHFNRLLSVLPANAEDNDEGRQRSKAEVLDLARRRIRELQQRNKELLLEQKEIIARLAFC